MTRVTLSLALLLSFTGSALAQEAASSAREKKDKVTPVQKIDIEDEVVNGDMLRPLGEIVNGKRQGRHSSLVKPRENFVPELQRSVSEL